MARDADALKIQKWAATGDVQDPEDGGLVRSTGWDATYSQPGGNLPKREHINQLLRELSAQGVEVNVHGAGLEWDSSISYEHPAMVMGSDARPYLSVQNSAGADPVNDASETYWTVYEAQGERGEKGDKGDKGDPGDGTTVPNASTLVAGKVELATDAETQTGTDTTRAVTPAGLVSRIATESRSGLVEKATQAEADAGTDATRYMTPDLVKHRIDAQSITVVKTSNQSSTSSIFQNDNDLLFSIGANEIWAFTILLIVSGNPISDIKVTVTAPSGASWKLGGIGPTTNAHPPNADNVNFDAQRSTDHVVLRRSDYGIGTIPGAIVLFGSVINGATAGTLQLQWARVGDSNNPTIVESGSFLQATRVA